MKNFTDEQLLEELSKRMEERRRSFDNLQEVMEQLKEVNRKLEESEALKSQFLSNIKNEINNPIASALGLAKNIMHAEHIEKDKMRQMTEMIYDEIFMLSYQLRNIFAAAEVEAGEAHPQVAKTDVNELIMGVIEDFKQIADKQHKQISFEYDFKCRSASGDQKVFRFFTDPEKFRIILSNIVGNAVEYSPKAGVISIQAKCKDEKLSVTVIDKGSGIAKSDLSKIYDRFRQLDHGMTKMHRGHGLGLSVTKSLLELIDGEISVESAKNFGTTVSIALNQLPTDPDMPGGYSDSANELLFDNDDFEDEETF